MSVVPHNLRLDQAPPTADVNAANANIPPGLDVIVMADGEGGYESDPETGTITIPTEDGGVIVDLNPAATKAAETVSDHDANLADVLEPAVLQDIASELMTGIQQDEEDNKQWLENRALGIRLLGLNVNTPKSDVTSSAAGTEGMSTVVHPLMLEATLRFQANARGELLPSQGPVKIETALEDSSGDDDIAEKFEKDMNFYMTKVATEYVPDTDRMLFLVGFGGCMFKKIYNCPIRRRPVSESVDAADLIVSNAITDMANSTRVTHRIKMRQSTLKRMQLLGTCSAKAPSLSKCRNCLKNWRNTV